MNDEQRPPKPEWDMGGHLWKLRGQWCVSFSDGGCGCCSSGEEFFDVEKAIAAVERYVSDREEEIAWWKDWLATARVTGKIAKEGS